MRAPALVLLSAATAFLVLFAAESPSASTWERQGEGDCNGGLAESVVRTFLAALGRGDVTAVDAVFAQEPSFGWYSTTAPGARRTRVAADRSSLARYFGKRIAQHERMRITKRHSGVDASRGTAFLNGQLERRARDLGPTRFNFKTAVLCSPTPQIIVWSMARDRPATPTRRSG